MRTSRLISSIFLALALSLFTVEISSAVTFPSFPPSGSATGGTFGLYFQRMVSPCPTGQVVTGFATGTSTYGTIICAVPPAGSETDPQVGTNTANYLPKWDGSALVTSQIFDSGTVVGIGTSTGTYKFEVAGSDIMVNGIRIGKGSGSIATNTVLGTGTLSANTSGNSNTAIGYRSLSSNTNGAGNTAVGHTALTSNIGGSQNTALGYLAMTANTTGNQNIAIGYQSLNANTGGVNNTVVGAVTLTSSKGDSNIAFGNFIGSNLTTGSNNILIGNSIYAASASASNTLNIGNLIYGTSLDGFFSTPSSGNIGIGVISPTYKLEVAGTGSFYGLRVSSGASAGKVLTSDATGNASWQSAGVTGGQTNYLARWLSATTLGTGSITDNGTNVTITGDAHINGMRIGRGSGSIASNTTVGNNALTGNTTGYNNSAYGYNSLSINSLGSNNTANGYLSLQSNTIGNQNTAIGSYALSNNTGGIYNTANGYSSLAANTTGDYNTANGTLSLNTNTTGINNLASGHASMYGNISGSNNTANGVGALFSNAIGSQNLALGGNAGYNLTSGDYNIFIGYNAQPNIGNTSSNQINIGNAIYGYNGNIGIGVLNPTSKLEIDGNLKINNATATVFDFRSATVTANYGAWRRADGTGTIGYIGGALGAAVGGGTANDFVIRSPAGNILLYPDSGNIGIGITSPGYKLDVAGTANATAFRGDGSALTALTAANISAGTAGINISGNAATATNATNATTAATANAVSFNGGLTTASSPTFAGLTVSGNETVTGDLTVQGKLITDQIVNRTVTNVSISGSLFPDSAAPLVYRDIGSTTQRWNNLYLSGQIAIGGGSPGAGKVLTSDATGLATWSGVSYTETDPEVGANTTNYVSKWNGTSLVTATGVYDLGGRVGIGTTNPGNMLEITQGTAGNSGLRFTNLPSTNTVVITTLATTGTWPEGTAVDTQGNAYVANFSTNNVTKITPSGVSTTFATAGTGPRDITIDSADNLYVANGNSNNVTKITPAGVSSTFGTTGAQPTRIIMDSSGNIYTLNYSASTITKITPAGVSTLFATGPTDWYDFTIDKSGNIYTVAYSGNQVQKITPAGVVTTLATGVSYYPSAIAVDNDANVYINDTTWPTASPRLVKITPSGVVSTFATGVSQAPALYSTYLTADDSGNIYSANYRSASKISPDGIVTQLGATGLENTDIVVGKDGNLYTTNATSNNITKFTLSQTKYLTTNGSGDVIAVSPFIAPGIVGQTLLNNGSSWVPSSQIFNKDGNIGIGTTTPAATLDVKGDALINGVTIGLGGGNVSSNTANGYRSLYSNVGGTSNVAYGWSTLENNTGGTQNTALGYTALRNNRTGNGNIAVGMQSLLANTVGAYNVAMGHQALYSNTGGSYGVALGYQALYLNTTGWANDAIGSQSMMSNRTGNNNVALGGVSLGSNDSGNANVALGQYSLAYNSTGSNNTAVGNETLYYSKGNFNTALGYQAFYDLGSNSPPDSPGHYNIAIGPFAGGGLTSGSDNIFIGRETAPSVGYGAVSNELNIGNVIFGKNIGTVGTGSVGIGTQNPTAGYMLEVYGKARINGSIYGAGHSTSIAGTSQVALGDNAGQSMTGSLNIAIGGTFAGRNMVGTQNIALGGYYPGDGMGGTTNTALGGTGPGQYMVGNQNTAIGGQAAGQSMAGTQNTAIGGNFAGQSMVGTANTAIGSYATITNSSVQNSVVIGSGARSNQSGAIILGSARANVGINTSTPGSQFDVRGQFRLGYTGGTVSERLTLPSSATNMWNFDNNAGTLRIFRENFTATGSGPGGVVAMQINDAGNITFNNNINSSVFGMVNAGNAISGGQQRYNEVWSDRSVKKDITPLRDSLSKIRSLTGVSWTLSDEAGKYGLPVGKHDIGLVAQDVRVVFPDVVNEITTDFAKGKLTLTYDHLIGPIVEAIKELANRGDSRDREIEKLREANKTLEARLEKLEKVLQK